MLCQFEKLLYPKDAHAASAGSYMVAVYRPCEIVRDSSGSILPQFKAVGYFLPVSNHLRYDMKGHWSRNTKHGTQFEVDSYDEVIIPSREGIIGYLSSGQIKGIGPRIAEKIYDAYGNLALEVLDKEPDKLLGIPGISQTRLTKICDSYLANRAARDVVAFLTPYGITANRAVKLYKEYGKEAMSIVKEHPYQLCELAGIGFKTADKIASSVGFTPLSTERVDAALLYTLTEAESRGHLCMEKHAFIKSCSKLLDTPELTEEMLANRAARLVSEGDLVSYQGMVYGSLKQQELLAFQELNYRIATLELMQAYCRTAPVTTELGAIGYHYQLVIASFRALLVERRFGPKGDEQKVQQRATALKSLEAVFNDQCRRFQSFNAGTPELYRKSVQEMINTVLPVWVSYRTSYINIEEVLS